MRLTQYQRDAFLRAVMDDVPAVDHGEQIRVLVQDAALAAMPPKVRAIHRDKALRGYLCTSNINVGGTYYAVHAPRDFAVPADVRAKLDVLVREKNVQQEQRRDLHNKLRAVVGSCTTRKQLVEALPEFEKYAPTDASTGVLRSAPVIANVVSDFVAAGWPKGKAKGAKK